MKAGREKDRGKLALSSVRETGLVLTDAVRVRQGTE